MRNRSYEDVVYTCVYYGDISLVQAHTCTSMGRPRLHNTPEDKLSVKRVNSKKYYEK